MTSAFLQQKNYEIDGVNITVAKRADGHTIVGEKTAIDALAEIPGPHPPSSENAMDIIQQLSQSDRMHIFSFTPHSVPDYKNRATYYEVTPPRGEKNINCFLEVSSALLTLQAESMKPVWQERTAQRTAGADNAKIKRQAWREAQKFMASEGYIKIPTTPEQLQAVLTEFGSALLRKDRQRNEVKFTK